MNEILDILENMFIDTNKPYINIRPKKYEPTPIQQSLLDWITTQIDYKFTMVTVNYNNELPPHKHRNNGINKIMLLGSFSGGALCIGNDKYTTKNVWFDFDGSLLHWVEPFEGKRFSIVLYKK